MTAMPLNLFDLNVKYEVQEHCVGSRVGSAHYTLKDTKTQQDLCHHVFFLVGRPEIAHLYGPRGL